MNRDINPVWEPILKVLTVFVTFVTISSCFHARAQVETVTITPSLISTITSWIYTHWDTILQVLAIWSFIATVINRKWPQPSAPPWKVFLHTVLIDWPAVLPSLNGKTILGKKFSLPYINLSKPVEETSAPVEEQTKPTEEKKPEA